MEGEDKTVSLTLKEAEYEVMINYEVPENIYSGASYLLHIKEGIFNEDGQLVVSGEVGVSHREYLKKGRYLVMCMGMYYITAGGGKHGYSVGTGKWIEVDGNTEVTIPVAISNIKWSQSGDTLYISGTGKLEARYWDYYEEKVKKVVIGSGIECIGTRVFEWEDACTGIEEIIIPSSVKVIDGGAFLGCSGLKNMTVPSSVCYIGNSAIGGSMMESLKVYVPCAERTMFSGQVKNLTIGSKKVTGDGWGGLAENIVLTDEVEEAYASFSGDIVKTVTMGNSIKTELKAKTFYGCSNLQKVKLHKITIVPDYAFDGCINLTEIEIPETVSIIGKRAFAGCTGFTEIEIPEIVSAIGEGAFYGCSSLTRIATIGKGAFEGHSSLAEIEIPESISGIGKGAFAGCISLAEIKIPENISAIGEGAFEGCAGLTKIEIPENVSSIGEGAFKGCSSLDEIEMPKNASDIGKSVFEGCSLLTEIRIPEGITEIKEQTFKDCAALKMAIVPESLITIKSKAFYNCISLESVKISKNVQTIGYEAFRKCSSLKTVDMTEATVSKIDEFAFGETAIKKFTIPETVTTMGAIMSGVALDELTVLGCEEGGFNLQEDLNATAKKIILNVPKVVKVGNSECETIIIGEKVKRIEIYAFKGASHLKEIVWPKHLEYLGYIDFSEFTELEELNMPDKIDSGGQSISKMPASLKKVKLPEGYSEIYIDAFTKCTNLKEVQLPASIEKIWFDAFANCKNLESVTFNEGSHLKSIGSSAFHGCTSLKKIVLGNEVETIYEDAFMGCTSLTEAVVPSGKTYCNGKLLDSFSTSWAFDECPNLTSLTLGSENVVMSANSTMTGLKKITLLDTVKEISKGTCPNVEEIVIPASVKTMEQRAFNGWTGLRKVTILGDKIQLPKSLFSGCTALEEVNIQGEITDLEDNVFSGCKNLKKIDQSKLLKHMYVVPAGLFAGCSSLTKAEVSDHITEIGASAYRDCTGLTELELPDHITDIKEGAFECCTSLTEIDIPKSVESIGVGAFYGCRNLKSVFIPASVTSIRENTFDNRWIKNICFEDMHTYYGGDILSIVYSSQGGDIDLRQERMRDEIYYDRLDQVHAQMKSINIFYPAGQTVTEQYKEHLGLQYCTWIPYTGSLDDPEAFMASEELQAAVGADGFSDGLSEAETGTAEPEVTEEQAQPEEVIISDEEESAEESSSESSDADDNSEISVEEEFDDGEELIINEIEKPVFEAAENFTSGSAVLELNAAGEAVSGVIQKQTYTGLVENSNCFFAVVRDKETVDFFAPSNLLFMTQAVSDDDGNLTIEYCTADNTGIPVLYGAEKSLDLSNAEITVEEGLAYTGQEQKPTVTVACSGETLTEGKDYVLRGNTAVTDAGTYTIKIVGRNSYKGSVEREYQVAKVKQKISTGMMARELTTGSRVSLRAAGIGTIS